MSFRSVVGFFRQGWRAWFSHAAGLRREVECPLHRAGIQPGLYHYIREVRGRATRFHLRVDRSGSGLLLAGASVAVRLRASGVILAKGLLENDDRPAVLARLKRSFRSVSEKQANQDADRMRALVEQLAVPSDTYPVINLADPTFMPAEYPLDCPLSADMPLAEPEWVVPLLDRMWELGIPHVTLIAGDEPDAAALLRAVERAEDLGMIAGVRGRGSVLGGGTLIHDLAQAGVDHLNVLYLAADGEEHDRIAGAGDHKRAMHAFEQAHENDICPVAEIALTEASTALAEDTINSLNEHHVRTAGVFAIATEGSTGMDGALSADALIQTAGLLEEAADEANLHLLWYPPVRFQPGSSLPEAVRFGPRCSGDTAVRVEPDGSVIPPRGPYRVGGNLLNDPGAQIFESAAFRQYRARMERDTHCTTCPGLAVCAADCPRNALGWADGRAATPSVAIPKPEVASEEISHDL